MPNNHFPILGRAVLAFILAAMPMTGIMAAEAAAQDTSAPERDPESTSGPATSSSNAADTPSSDSFEASESISEDVTIAYPVDI